MHAVYHTGRLSYTYEMVFTADDEQLIKSLKAAKRLHFTKGSLKISERI